jgi:hypothetical protein
LLDSVQKDIIEKKFPKLKKHKGVKRKKNR